MQIMIESLETTWPRAGAHPSGFDDMRVAATGLGLHDMVLHPGRPCLVALRGGIPTTAQWGLERNADHSVHIEHLATSARMRRLLGISRCVTPATVLIARERSERGQEPRAFGFRSRLGDTMYAACIIKTMNGRDGPDRRFIVITRPTFLCPHATGRIPVLLRPDLVEVWLASSTPIDELLRIAARSIDADVQVRPVRVRPDQDAEPRHWQCAVEGPDSWAIPGLTGPEEILL